jgi:hypothetical protein
MHTYADDTQIYVSGCPTTADGVRDAVTCVEKCVAEIQEWMSTNFLKLNAEKTEILIFGFRAQLAKFSIHHVQIAGVDIPVLSNPVKNLGVMFDCHMSMSAQVASIIKAANFQLINIGRARKMLTTDATKLAVHTLVTSKLDYCNSLLIGLDESLLKRLQNIQRTSARLVTRKRKYDPISADLIDLHWLPIKQRIDFKVLVLVYKSIHHQTPQYISDMLQVQPIVRRLRSNSSHRFVELRTHRSIFADKSFSCYAPKIWNQLPELIKCAESVDIFKKLLKHHLFELVYNQ